MSLKWSSVTDQLYAVSNSSPSLDLDFAANKTLDDNISGTNLVTFSRASSGTYVDSDGLIKTSAVNLLYNTTTYSNWVPSGQSIQTNAAISPSGSNDAVKLVADASAGEKILYRSVTTTATNVCSIYAKAGEYTNIQLRELSAARFYVNFDLSSGTYVAPQSGSAPAGGFDFISADIQDVGNGWYRCSVVNSRIGGLALSVAGYPDSETGTASLPNFTGDGTSGVLLWGAQVEEGTTATTYIPTTTTIGGAPRFDHDPATLQSLGLLIEEERTNLVTYSEQFDGWIKLGSSNTSVTPNTTIAPDGTNTADLVSTLATTTFNGDLIYQQISNQDNKNLIGSVYVKSSGSASIARFFVNGASGVDRQTVDVTLTNEWQRVLLPIYNSASANAFIHLKAADGDNQVKSFYAWGAQLEEGPFPTSYIPTSGSAVPREADVATIEGTNFSSWYSQSEGTVFSDVTTQWLSGRTTNGTILQIDNGTNSTGRLLHKRNGSNGSHDFNFSGVAVGVAAPNNSYKAASGYNTSSYITCADKTLSGEGNVVTGNLNTLIRAQIGSNGNNYLNGHISRLAYYPYRLSDTILQEITS